MLKKYKLPILSLEELQSQLEAASKCSDVRQKLKMFRQLAFQTANTFKKNQSPSLKELEVYEVILREALKSPVTSYPASLKMSLNKIALAKFDIMGIKESRIIAKKSGKICLESGTIVIQDSLFNTDLSLQFDDLLSRMNEGLSYYFSTAADGVFNIQLRVVEAPEPFLTAKEYKLAQAASQMFNIKIPSGKVIVSDFGNEEEPACTMDIVPGNYQVRIFVILFPGKTSEEPDYSYYIVLASTPELIHNNVREIEVLEFS